MKMLRFISEAREMVRLKNEWARVCPDVALRNNLLTQFLDIRKRVDCPHNESHILSFVVEMFAAHSRAGSDGIFVEAGCYKGGSTAKLSRIAKHLGRKLVVFDSFEGLPSNQEDHDKNIFGDSIKGWFEGGHFAGSLQEVQKNVSEHGDIEVCRFIKGWFDDTMPGFREPILGAYIDVDLASSTRTCLKYIYPLIVPGGVLISQDGDFPLVLERFEDERLWQEEIGCPMPEIQGLRQSKILKIVKT